MTRCAQAGCTNTDLRPYKRYIGHGLVLLCGACAASLQAIGMSLTPIERRETDMAVVTERRRIGRPRWMDRLSARSDESWRAAS